jgi:hypothetical protein
MDEPPQPPPPSGYVINNTAISYPNLVNMPIKNVFDVITDVIRSPRMEIFREFMSFTNTRETRDLTIPSTFGSHIDSPRILPAPRVPLPPPPPPKPLPLPAPHPKIIQPSKWGIKNNKKTQKSRPLVFKLYDFFFNNTSSKCSSPTTMSKKLTYPAMPPIKDPYIHMDRNMNIYDVCELLPVLEDPYEGLPEMVPFIPIPADTEPPVFSLTRVPSSSTHQAQPDASYESQLSMLHVAPNTARKVSQLHLDFFDNVIGNEKIGNESTNNQPLKSENPLIVFPVRSRICTPSVLGTSSTHPNPPIIQPPRNILIIYICAHGLSVVNKVTGIPESLDETFTERYNADPTDDTYDELNETFSSFVKDNLIMWPYAAYGLNGQDVVDSNMLFDLNVIHDVISSTDTSKRQKLDVLLQTMIYLNGPNHIPGRGSAYNNLTLHANATSQNSNWWSLLYRTERGLPIKWNRDISYGGEIFYDKDRRDLKQLATNIASTNHPTATITEKETLSNYIYNTTIKKYDRRIGILYTDLPPSPRYTRLIRTMDELNLKMTPLSSKITLTDILAEIWYHYPEVQLNIIDFACRGSNYLTESSHSQMSRDIDAALEQIRNTCSIVTPNLLPSPTVSMSSNSSKTRSNSSNSSSKTSSNSSNSTKTRSKRGKGRSKRGKTLKSKSKKLK